MKFQSQSQSINSLGRNQHKINKWQKILIFFFLETPPSSSKSDFHPTPSLFSPDILSPMSLQQHRGQQNKPSHSSPFNLSPPRGPPDQQIFSLHIMIDSYRRAAKYLLDTANHLELVARHGNHGNTTQSSRHSNAPSNTCTETKSADTKKEKQDE